MTGKLTKPAYEQLISEDLIWLARQERSIEKMHIEAIVKRSVALEYPKINERDSCKNRPNGFYTTRAHGRDFEEAEFTDNGWKAVWSDWFQNDSDFEEILEESHAG